MNVLVFQRLASAARRLLRRPVPAAGIVLPLTLGIGIAVGMFSVLHGVMLRALPYPDAERIVVIRGENPELGAPSSGVTLAEAVEGLSAVPGFEHTAYYRYSTDMYTFTGGDVPRNISNVEVSADYFSVFAVPAALGRTLIEADFSENRRVAVLNHAAWVTLTGGDPNAVGRTLEFHEGSFELVGVLPESFAYGGTAPLMHRPLEELDAASGNYLTSRRVRALGRLSPGISPEVAQEGLRARQAAVNDAYNLPDDGWRLRHVPLIDSMVGDVRTVLHALFAVALLVLLIACSTAASLVSIRLRRRRAELALRCALGASHGRIAADVALELLVLAALAALGGVLLAHWMIAVLQPLAAGYLPRARDIGIDAPVLRFAAAATAGCVLLSGALPLVRALRGDPAEKLRAGAGREIEGGRRIAWLPAAGVGLATIALITALALALSLIRLGDVDPGFRTDNIAALMVFQRPAELHAFLDRAFEELRAVPGVRDVAAVVPSAPTAPRQSSAEVFAQGREPGESIRAIRQVATPGYHGLLGIALLGGRDISAQDVIGAPNVAVINETLARRAFGDTNVVGEVLMVPLGSEHWPYEVVGVAADTRNAGLRAAAEPEMVTSLYAMRVNAATLLVDSAIAPPGWMRTLHEAIWRLDPNQAITRSFTLAEDLDSQVRGVRFFALATGWFAVLALLLGASGIHAVIAAMQRRRAREIGLRMALGAAPARAAVLVLDNALRIVGLGFAVGALLAVPALWWFQDQLFGVDGSTYWKLFGLAALVLAGAGLAASAGPAWRAACTAPMHALRVE